MEGSGESCGADAPSEGESTSESAFDPAFAGVWAGTTSANQPVRFLLLEDGTLAGFMLTVQINLGTGTCTGPLTARTTPQLDGTDISVALQFPLGTPSTEVTGSFTSTTTATGSYSSDLSDAIVVLCGDSATIGSGGGTFSGGTWQATKCESCSTVCEYTADGLCDEPSGTGLCFLGTDGADCQSASEETDSTSATADCVAPESASVTDFSNLADDGTWGDMDGVWGGQFVYGTVEMDTSESELRIQGSVSNYSGGGIFFGTCVDASAYSGISFSISGDPGPRGEVSVSVLDQCDGCFDRPSINVPVTASEQEVRVSWEELSNGVPEGPFAASELSGLTVAFDASFDPPYVVDIVIDDVSLW